MLEKLRINRFCCCCTIRTGSLIIGVFGWIGSLFHSIALASPKRTTTIEYQENEMIVSEESTSNVGPILTSIFMFGMSVALVIGIYRDNRRFILPWLIVKFIEACVLTIITFVIFFALFVVEEVAILFLIFVIVGGITGLFWYCWICVWSLYLDMGESTTTIMPVGQSIPMTDQRQQYPQHYPQITPDNIKSPPQEMV